MSYELMILSPAVTITSTSRLSKHIYTVLLIISIYT